jgi:hypothetical protein
VHWKERKSHAVGPSCRESIRYLLVPAFCKPAQSWWMSGKSDQVNGFAHEHPRQAPTCEEGALDWTLSEHGKGGTEDRPKTSLGRSSLARMVPHMKRKKVRRLRRLPFSSLDGTRWLVGFKLRHELWIRTIHHPISIETKPPVLHRTSRYRTCLSQARQGPADR